jgi:hypothetical protein
MQKPKLQPLFLRDSSPLWPQGGHWASACVMFYTRPWKTELTSNPCSTQQAGYPLEAGPPLLGLPRGCLSHLSPREGTSSVTQRGACVQAVALHAGFLWCWALVRVHGWGARVCGLHGLGGALLIQSGWLTTFLPLSSPGCVHFQRCTNDSSHHGKLRVPQVGPGCGLAHGSVIHGSHSWVHGLHVPHLKGLPEAGVC